MKYQVQFSTLPFLVLLHNLHSASPSQSTVGSSSGGSNDPFSDFNNDFQPELQDMDREDRIHSELEAGFDKWEDKCLRVGGQNALDQWLKAQENLVYCVMQNFDISAMQSEVEAKKKTGDLDLVFKKYCGAPVEKTRPCVVDFLKVSRRCLRSKDKPSLDITLHMIDAAIDFMCHNRGDRIALFMAENGMDCVEQHREDIMKCVNTSVPELFNRGEQYSNIHLIVFSQENCRKGEAIRVCIEKSLLKCPDPTPSNVVNSLLLSMLNATPCKGLSARHTAASPAATAFTAFKGHYSLLMVSFIMIFATSISTDLSFRTFNS